MERCELSRKELARYSVIENTIEGYLKIDQAEEELPFKPIVPLEDERYVPSQMEALAVEV